jgi:hypothetical protein
MSGKPELLCVGHDAVLNRTRRLILEKCFAVKVAHSVPEAIAQLSGQRFGLVLLCYSLTEEECRAIVEFVHGLPSPMRILTMADGRDRLLLGPQDDEFLSGGPAELLRKAASMAGIPSLDAARPAAEEPSNPTERVS